MTSSNAQRPKPISVPPPQEAMRTVLQRAVEALSGQSEDQLNWLGASRSGSHWHLPVMDGVFRVDVDTGQAWRGDGNDVRPYWQILTLHYLAIRGRPVAQEPQVTFASLPGARVYASVYENRVNRRLCATAGKDKDVLRAAAATIGARPIEGGDIAFEINVFPRIPVRLIWYAGDEEFPPSCALLLPANIESFLCTEDIVVLSESFVARLSGKPF